MFCICSPEDQGLSNQESFQKRTEESPRPSSPVLQQLWRGAAATALRLPCQHSAWQGMVLRGAVIRGRDVGTALRIFGWCLSEYSANDFSIGEQPCNTRCLRKRASNTKYSSSAWEKKHFREAEVFRRGYSSLKKPSSPVFPESDVSALSHFSGNRLRPKVVLFTQNL